MIDDVSDQKRIAKERIGQIFKFLKALNEHRNPAIRQVREQPWSMWLDSLPDHPSVKFPQRVARSTSAEGEAIAAEPDFILRVRRPKLTTAPVPPDEVSEWLEAGWDDPHKEVVHLASRNEENDEGEVMTVRFEDDPARTENLERWLKKREAWRAAELPSREAMAVFDKLYGLHGRLEREAERVDLVVGDGVLSWQQPGGSIQHPILLQRVQLMFDPHVPEFTIVDADFGSEVYTPLFHSAAEVDPQVLRSVSQEFGAGGYHPLDEEASGFLESFVNRLSAQGSFVGDKRPEPATEHPTIGRAPVLFLRSRTKGFGNAIEQVIAGTADRDDYCDALRNIVGCESVSSPELNIEIEPRPRGAERPACDILFGKPANPEQSRIAQAIDRHGSVLVQGPPGTGKSHTIANLIGHLLARGQSVLVTSHTTKALRVLRDHLVEELRPLCVSVLQSDLESRAQLEESVQAISSRLSNSEADDLEREASWLEQQRAKLIEELGRYQEELKNARADEYRDVTFGGQGIAPSDAARLVAKGKGEHDWIPGPVAAGEPCPLSAIELRELYATNESTRPDDDRLVDRPLPDAAELPSPEDLARSFVQSDKLAEDGQWDRRYWPDSELTSDHIVELDSLFADLTSAVDEFATFDDCKLAAVDAGRGTAHDRRPWDLLLAKIDEAVLARSEAKTDVIIHDPQVSEPPPLETQATLASEIHRHLAGGGRLGRMSLAFRGRWKNVLSVWQVQGQSPETAEQIVAIQRWLSVKIVLRELQPLWDGLMAPHGAPKFTDLGDEPERTAHTFAAAVGRAVPWWQETWLPLERRLHECGFDWDRFLSEQPPDLTEYGEMQHVISAVQDRLIGALEQTRDYLEAGRLQEQTGDVLTRLRRYPRPEVDVVCRAIQDRDGEAYSRAHNEYLAAVERQRHAVRRKELLSRLTRRGHQGQAVAEAWAERIRNRRGHHGKPTPPGDVTKAWEWRQLNDELDRRGEADLEEIGRKITDLQDQLKRVTNELIERKAWSGQIRRTTPAKRQALMGWLGIIKKIGTGFTKRAPALCREAQQMMERCRDAVPVWIMPISRLVESFDFSSAQFDVVIIDEASQSDVMALLALAISRKVIVVGDDKQVSPVAIGQDLSVVEKLIKLHLEGIPNAILYDGRRSIYDVAQEAFPGRIRLLEHFRCVPDVIQFSNHLSYDGDIKPLRGQASSPLKTHVVPYRVEGATRGNGKVNQQEAVHAASLVVAACEHDAYAGQSIGVISLLGDDQAMEIERLLLQHLESGEYEKRRIICGNSAQFQGDERDVMFLSMVDSPGSGPLRLRQSEDFQRRYNVAASRARNQMWVVHSLNYQVDLKPGDLRRRLIEHVSDPSAITRELETASARTESLFERQVYERLIRRGYRPQCQWSVGYYRIDLAFPNSMVAIECDGDRYHPIEKLPEDMARQAILERLGWRFIRIRGTRFFRDPDAAIEPVFARLDDLGVCLETPELDIDLEAKTDKPSTVDEIIRRAAELRAEWQDPDVLDIPEATPEDELEQRPSPVGQVLLLPDEHLPSSSLEIASDNSGMLEESQLNSPSDSSDRSHQEPMREHNRDDGSDGGIVCSGGDEVGPSEEFQLFSRDSSSTLSTSLEERILKLLARQPGLKRSEIARELRVQRKVVGSLLYRSLSHRVHQDAEYRWSLRETNQQCPDPARPTKSGSRPANG